MGENSKISWTDHTFNPWVGCFKVSEGCQNCYAETQMTRKERWSNTWGPAVLTQRLKTSEENWKKPRRWNMQADHLGIRYKVFCASLADVFEDNQQVDPWRKELFSLMQSTSFLDWQVLTKRPENILDMVPKPWLEKWPANVWIGTSVENQDRSDERIPELIKVPAAIRFLSVEPMLGKIDFRWYLPYLHWVIFGGESGPGHRDMDMSALLFSAGQCKRAGVPVFVKQDSAPTPGQRGRIPDCLWLQEFPDPPANSTQPQLLP